MINLNIHATCRAHTKRMQRMQKRCKNSNQRALLRIVLQEITVAFARTDALRYDKIMKYITEYNQLWSEQFDQIAMHLKLLLPDSCKIHHVGSTSVPGMAAKDVIDLDIEYTYARHTASAD